MSKPWRMVALGLGAWLAYALLRGRGGTVIFVRLSVLDWTCLLIIAGCLQTIGQRLGRILRALQTKSGAA